MQLPAMHRTLSGAAVGNLKPLVRHRCRYHCGRGRKVLLDIIAHTEWLDIRAGKNQACQAANRSILVASVIGPLIDDMERAIITLTIIHQVLQEARQNEVVCGNAARSVARVRNPPFK